MSSYRFRDEYGDLFLIGTGYICRIDKENIWIEETDRYKPELHFCVMTRVKQVKVMTDDETEEKVSSIERYRCVIQNGSTNPFMYALAKTLRIWEKISFTGAIREFKYTDKNGVERVSNEVLIENFMLPDRLAALLIGKVSDNAKQGKKMKHENKITSKAAAIEKHTKELNKAGYEFD